MSVYGLLLSVYWFVSLTSLALRCRLGEEESIPLLWVVSGPSRHYHPNVCFSV